MTGRPWPPSAAWQILAELPVDVRAIDFERLERDVGTRGYRRVATLVRLEGRGEQGVGEDLVYDAADHDVRPAAAELEALVGERTLGTFSEVLDAVELWPRAPANAPSRRYRRWAFESAALDLALRQAGASLAETLGRRSRPLHFVASLGLGDPPTMEPVRRLLGRYPQLRLKLDPTPAWDDDLLNEVAATGAVVTLDLKGIPRGVSVDQRPDPALYRRVLEAFPDAWIEDPALTVATRALLEPHRGRITWDAPIGGPADLEALPWSPPTVNVKPSRCGTIARLVAMYEHCETEGIEMYGGGQFELGPGRKQIQRLASLFHPAAPNDVAPLGYNAPRPAAGLPGSPLDLGPPAPGLG
ncbi:MAG TPA: hypothetical protein VGO80_10395 [Solirubrobacteraceae bacterium]|jgi:L-alanine-DL-glutamate epimerase-like enolase superfamily enzyme|nr:hypothetical protein [Solirubrobacteraceae bacterium]